ncbi:MAG: hypothetical protein ACI4D8_07480 [Wujia sp.]
MFKVINEYMNKINLQVNDRIYRMLGDYLSQEVSIAKYTITVNFMRYNIDIRLKNYSVEEATKVFNRFNESVSYPYSSLHIRFNEGKCVRYRYVTCKEDRNGFYCDILLS